jgi:hypothetical protein
MLFFFLVLFRIPLVGQQVETSAAKTMAVHSQMKDGHKMLVYVKIDTMPIGAQSASTLCSESPQSLVDRWSPFLTPHPSRLSLILFII